MTIQEIISIKGENLYQGDYQTFTECLESAIAQNIPLNYADLSFQNLTNLNGDGADLEFTDFTGSNLTGANLSESLLHGCVFKDTSLYNTCLAYSDISFNNFKGASFGATNITGSNISHSRFSTLSCFSLEFIHAENMRKCTFEASDDTISAMSSPPVIIHGYDAQPIIFLDEDIRRGHEKLDARQWVGIFNSAPPEKIAV